VAAQPLDTCSKPGMAMTGFTRDGHCQDLGDDDAGSHHICIQMKDDFCTQTGQPNWCADEMECMGQAGQCPIGNWCVCQWAFATYIQMAGGCDAIVELECEATNLAAVKAYEKVEAEDAQIEEALECIKKKCPQTLISDTMLNDASVPASALRIGDAKGATSTLASQALFGPLAIACLLGAIAAIGIGGARLIAAARRASASSDGLE